MGHGRGWRRTAAAAMTAIGTIAGIAAVVNRGLAAHAKARVPRSAPSASWGRPDETIPRRAVPGR